MGNYEVRKRYVAAPKQEHLNQYNPSLNNKPTAYKAYPILKGLVQLLHALLTQLEGSLTLIKAPFNPFQSLAALRNKKSAKTRVLSDCF